jgi:hypothetical protein
MSAHFYATETGLQSADLLRRHIQAEKLALYERMKAIFLRDNPQAPDSEFAAFCRVLREEIGL